MKLTKSQKISFAALGVGLCALGYDQLGGSGPAAAVAADVALAVSAVTGPADASTGAAAAVRAEDLSLVPRLAALRSADGAGAVRNVFAPSPAWLGGTDATAADADAHAAAFRAAHTLKAVVTAGRRPSAMVDDRLLLVGQTLDGWTLVSVDAGRAIFVVGRARAELLLPGGAAGTHL